MTKKGGKAKIGICGFLRRKINEGNKDRTYLGGIPVEWHIGESPMESATSYAGEIQASFYRFDPSRFLKSLVSDLLLRYGNVDIETSERNDNRIVVEHVHSINSVTIGRRLNSIIDRNREELNLNRWIRLYHIPGTVSIAEELGKSTSQFKLLTLLTGNISQAISAQMMTF